MGYEEVLKFNFKTDTSRRMFSLILESQMKNTTSMLLSDNSFGTSTNYRETKLGASSGVIHPRIWLRPSRTGVGRFSWTPSHVMRAQIDQIFCRDVIVFDERLSSRNGFCRSDGYDCFAGLVKGVSFLS